MKIVDKRYQKRVMGREVDIVRLQVWDYGSYFDYEITPYHLDSICGRINKAETKRASVFRLMDCIVKDCRANYIYIDQSDLQWNVLKPVIK